MPPASSATYYVQRTASNFINLTAPSLRAHTKYPVPRTLWPSQAMTAGGVWSRPQRSTSPCRWSTTLASLPSLLLHSNHGTYSLADSRARQAVLSFSACKGAQNPEPGHYVGTAYVGNSRRHVRTDIPSKYYLQSCEISVPSGLACQIKDLISCFLVVPQTPEVHEYILNGIDQAHTQGPD